MERISVGAFALGILFGFWFACAQDIPRPAGGVVPSIQELLQKSPALLWVLTILGVLWAALRTAAKLQLSTAEETGEKDDPKSERIASARALADIESIVSLGGAGFSIGVLLVSAFGFTILIAPVLVIALIATLGVMFGFKKYHLWIAEKVGPKA